MFRLLYKWDAKFVNLELVMILIALFIGYEFFFAWAKIWCLGRSTMNYFVDVSV